MFRNWFIVLFVFLGLFGCKPSALLTETSDVKVSTIISKKVIVKNGWFVSESYYVKFQQDSVFIQGFDFSPANAEKNFNDEEFIFVNLDTLYKVSSKEYFSWEDFALHFEQLYSIDDKGCIMVVFEEQDASEVNAFSFFKKLKDLKDSIGDIICFKVVSKAYLPALPKK